MRGQRIPDLSPEAQAFFQSILGSRSTHIEPDLLSADQIEQLLIVLEEELVHLNSSNDPAAAIRRREIRDFIVTLGQTR